MTWALEPIEINGKRVLLRNYQQKDFAAIAEAIHDPSGWFATNWGLDSQQKIEAMLELLVQAQDRGLHNAIVYCVGNEVAGITRLMRLEPAHKSLEIGGTWVAPKWRKSFVNTEVKFLLLQHCFESLTAKRVEFRVDVRNIESQRAVLRIGAKLEGRLRTRQLYPDGISRDGLLFSVISSEWEMTKENLVRRMKDPSFEDLPKENFPCGIVTPRLLLRQYTLADSLALFQLMEKNRPDLWENFPQTLKEISKRENADSYILNKLHQWCMKTFFCYAVIQRETGQHIGQFHIKNIKWEIPAVEFGYFLDIDHRRTGYGAEMLESVLRICQQDKEMKRVYLKILPTNGPSRGLAKKLNFDYEGLHKKEFITGKGDLVDVCYYSKT